MKIIRKDQTETFKNGNNCIAIEYPSDDKDINGAIIELTGRYPDKGKSVNLKSKELAYIIKGFGRVVINNEEFEISEGDLIYIEPNEKIHWEGNLTMFLPCTPAWTKEQYKKIDE